MRVEKVLSDCLVIEPTVFSDSRGFFLESFNQKIFNTLTGETVTFIQDNHSRSARNVLRGLHYQTEMVQGKLVRVVSGSVLDAAVDLRLGSPTFGKHYLVRLSAENKKQFWIPPGLAHGFLVESEECDVLYKTTDYYAPEFEICIRWDDPELNIEWGVEPSEVLISDKDSQGCTFSDAPKFG